MRRVAVTVGVLAVAGCAAVVGIDKDYVEGPIDGSTSDVTTDAFAPDGGDAMPVTDGSINDAKTQFCKSLDAQPLFCDDFDLGNPVGFNWTKKSQCPGCILLIDTDAAISAPASLFAMDVPDSSSTESYVTRSIAFAVKKSLRFEADVRMDLKGNQNNFADVPLELGLDGPGKVGEWRARLLQFPDHAELEEYELATDGGFTWDWASLTQFLVVGKWVHVRFDIDIVQHTIDISFDSTKVLTAHPLKFAWPVNGTPMTTVGTVLDRWGFNGNWAFRVDNVVVDAN